MTIYRFLGTEVPSKPGALNSALLSVLLISVTVGTASSGAQEKRFPTIDTPSEIELGVQALIASGKSLTSVLQGTYALALEFTNGTSATSAFKEIPLGAFQCRLADREQLKRIGYDGRIWMRTSVNTAENRLSEPTIVCELRHGVSIQQVLKRYPKDSVVDRVLRCVRLKRARNERRIVKTIQLSFGRMSWPNNPIDGCAFVVNVNLGGEPKLDSREDSPWFVAFSALYPVSGTDAKRRVKGPTPADELLVISIPTAIASSPELIDL